MAYEGGRCLTQFEIIDLAYGVGDQGELGLMLDHVCACKKCDSQFDRIVYEGDDPLDLKFRKPIVDAEVDREEDK